MLELPKVWKQSLKYLESKIGRDAVETWFQKTALEEVSGSVAKIGVSSKFFGEWLGRNYRGLIAEALEEQGVADGTPLDVQFIVKESSARPDQTQTRMQGVVGGGKTRKGQFLNPNYTFKNFVVGASNQYAHAASMAVAEAPGKTYNPYFIYGGVGLGKTHLLGSIGNFVAERTDFRIAYVTTEQFTNEVINSIRYDKMIELRRRYRHVDMLLIDDIQFLSGKERTQEEFFHTFNTLYEARKQIVFSGDCFPKEMPGIDERLRSRFEWGLIADIKQPDVETRIAILRKKSEDADLPVGDEVLQLLAINLKNNIRELEGALIRLKAHSSFTGESITTDIAKDVLRDVLGTERKTITQEHVQEAVATRFRVKVSDLKSKRRTKTLVYPRQVAMYLSRELTDASFPEIGQAYGGKDHTTIMHACKQVDKALSTDLELQKVIESLKGEITKA
ncbi:MAG: chromosomal replication initiator protein DnaA [Nitrospirales bacterium]|nr:chromosomal replication initiator protein DnaA [Nitrospirales bacterium]